MKAIWKDEIIAESNETIVVENNYYFPADSVKKEFLEPSDTKSDCCWKGEASYCTIKVGDNLNKDAAWFYPEPKEKALNIKDYVAFWKGVEIIE